MEIEVIEKELKEMQKCEKSGDKTDQSMFSKGSPILTILCC